MAGSEVLRNVWPEGALLAIGYGRVPIQPVLLADRAHESLSELPHAARIPNLAGVLALCPEVELADPDGVELVPADAPVHDLLDPFGGVEPPVCAAPDQGDRERPVGLADDEGGQVGGILPERPLLLGRLVQPRPVLAGGHFVLREQAVGVLGPEERAQGLVVAILERREQDLHRGLGGPETHLRFGRCGRYRSPGRQNSQQKHQRRSEKPPWYVSCSV